MRILIVEDGTQRGALGVVRALGRRGHQVSVASPRAGLSAWSRWCRTWYQIPPPTDPDALVNALKRLVRHADIICPIGDAEVLVVSRARSDLDALVPWPEHEVVEACLDKERLSVAATRSGVSVPRIIPIDAYREPTKVFVKERVHGEPGTAGLAPRTAAIPASTNEEVQRAVTAVRAAGGVPMLQEAVEGTLIAYSTLTDSDGNIWAEVQQRASAVFPPGAGVSVRAETVPVDPVIAAGARALRDELRTWGVIEMQFMEGAHAPPALIDLNPRFYGSVALAIAAGVDLPALWVEVATGSPPRARRAARAGVRYQWLEGDLRRALLQRQGGMVRDVMSTLAYAPRATHSIASFSDPRPLARFVTALSQRGVRKMTPWS